MTGYNDIRDAVLELISTAKPTTYIYGEEIQQGFKRPAFYIQLTPEQGVIINNAHREKFVLVDIAYFSAEHLAQQNRDMWSMADSLEELLGPTLKVGDRIFTVYNPNPEIIDQVLHYTFTLQFIDSREDAVVVALDPGETQPGQVLPQQIVLPDSELGYNNADDIVTMREIEIKEDL